MKTKTKKFAHKLLALVMAIVMGVTCFSGAFSSFAGSKDVKYYDQYVEYNELAWPVLSDEQTATAILDYLDTLLADVGPDLEKLIGNLISGLGVGVIKWDSSARTVNVNAVIVSTTVKVHLRSVDELLIDTLPSLHNAVSKDLKTWIGDGKNLQFDSTKNMNRTDTSSVDILKGVLGLLQKNSADYAGKDVLGEFLRGGFDLGTLGNLLKLDVYKLVGGLISGNMPSDYATDEYGFVYNVVKNLLFEKTNWFTNAEKSGYNSDKASFVLDDVLIEKLNSKFLRQINAEITYKSTDYTGKLDSQTESSKDRYQAIRDKMLADNITQQAAAKALGYDPCLVYTNDGNVRLFQYDLNKDGAIDDGDESSEVITLHSGDSLFTFGWQALDLAWKTALKDTIGTLRVNYDVDRGHGSNFDNAYYYWAKAEYGDWNTEAAKFNIADMYSPERISAWANHKVTETVTNFGTEEMPVWAVGSFSDEEIELGLTTIVRDGETITVINDTTKADPDKVSVIALPDDIVVTRKTDPNDPTKSWYETTSRALYQTYAASSETEFIDWVKNNYTFDREVTPGSTGSWKDIEPKNLFTKLRYSPLADYGFDMTTGPINLYFMQTGTPNLYKFFDTYKSNYTSLVAGINNALVAAVKDIFINRSVRSNVYGDENAFAYPSLQNTPESINKAATIGSSQIDTIVSTFIGNACGVIQYTADAIDSNILKAFYDAGNSTIDESNIEGAMMPLLIACIGRINLNGHKLNECIHAEDFNGCKDVEALLFVALREYLSYILPNNDYNSLASVSANGVITATLEGTILPMARDAVTYVMQGYVPVSYMNGNTAEPWDVYTMGGVNSNGTLKNNTSIFELLNSVVCYYGGEHSYTNSNVAVQKGAMGVGALLGICNGATGNSQITTNNTIWQNIDLVANKLLPMLGVLQYNDTSKSGNFSSEQLIWKDVVESLVNIGTVKSDANDQHNGKRGVTTILTELLTIVSASPIQSDSVVLTIYDLAEQFLNGLLGARYTSETSGGVYNQGWTAPVPKRSSAHPFDDVLKKTTIAGTSGENVGVIQKLICNFVEFSGYCGSGASNGGNCNAYPDSIMRGLLFAVKAVQSFVPSILGTIGDHTLGMATAQYAKISEGGISTNGSLSTTLTFTNNSVGVNNAYVQDNAAVQLCRYYMKIKSAVANGSGGATCSISGYDTSYLIAPGENVTLSATSGMSGTGSSVTATITYDICEQDGTVLYADNQVKAYQYLSGEKGWKDVVYPNGSTLNSTFLNSQGVSWGSPKVASKTIDGYNFYGTAVFRNMTVSFPEYLLLTTSDPYAIQNYQFAVSADQTRSVDAFYCYGTGTVYDDASKTNVTLSSSDSAIPVFDKQTGSAIRWDKEDILVSSTDNQGNITYYDTYYDTTSGDISYVVAKYKDADGVRQDSIVTPEMDQDTKEDIKEQSWDRGGIWGHKSGENDSGTGELGVSQAMNYFTAENGFNNFEVISRAHRTYTIDEMIDYGIMKAYHKNEAGVYEYVYLKQGSVSDHKFETMGNTLSFAGPCDGIYLNQGKMENIDRGETRSTDSLFKYDGSTLLEQGSYPVNLCAYNSTASGRLVGKNGGTCTLIIGDDSSVGELDSKFKEITNTLAQYRESDFTDADILNNTKTAIINSLAAKAAPLTPTSVSALSDQTYVTAQTERTASLYGDLAYRPFTGTDSAVIPEIVVDDVAHKMPVGVYAESNTTLNDSGIWCIDKAGTLPIYSNVVLTSDYVSNTSTLIVGKTRYQIGTDPAGKQIIKGTGDDDNWYLLNQKAYEMVWVETNTTDNRPYQVYKTEDGNPVQATNSKGEILYDRDTYVYRDYSGEKVNSDFDWDCKFVAQEARCKFDAATGSTVGFRGRYTAEKDSLTYWQNKLMDVIDDSLAWELVNNISIVRQGLNNNNFEVVTYNKMVDLAKTSERGYSFSFDYVKNGEVYHADYEGFADFMKYVNDDKNDEVIGVSYNNEGDLVIDSTKISLNSSMSSIQVQEYVRLFNIYLPKVVERGYNGLQLEAEILCASGNSYDTFTATAPTDDSDAVVNAPNGTEVPFGVIEDGMLVNNGNVVYDSVLWNNYINALATALDIAAIAHDGVDNHEVSAFYDKTAKNNYPCQVTDCYTADTNLQCAEIALENAKVVSLADGVVGGTVAVNGVTLGADKSYGAANDSWVAVEPIAEEDYEFVNFTNAGTGVGEVDENGYMHVKYIDAEVTPVFQATIVTPSGYNVTLSVEIAANVAAGTSTGLPVYGEYHIDIFSDADRTVKVAEADSSTVDGANIIAIENLEDGTYYATMTSDYMIPLENITIVVSGADIDGFVVPVVPADFNQDGTIGVDDAKLVFSTSAAGSSDPLFNYCNVNGDEYVGVDDAKAVFVLATRYSMPALTVSNG